MAKRDKTVQIKMANELPAESFITTGIKEVDEIVKFPRKRITEIYGLQGVGKTSFVLQSIAGMQKEDLRVLFIDVENALNLDRAEEFGVDLSKMEVATAAFLEDIAEAVEDNIDKYDAIIIDSVAAMIPFKEMDGHIGEAHVGLKARLMSQWMRKIVQPLAESNCALIFINQLRENIEMFSAKYSTPGGMALKYAASLRIQLKTTSKDRIRKGGERAGHKVHAIIKKSKVGKPHQEAVFKLMY